MIYFLNCFLQSESGTPVFRDPSVVDLFPSFGDAYAAGKQFFHRQIDLLKEDDLSQEEWMTSGWSYFFDIQEYSPDCEWKREWMFRFDGQPLHSRWVAASPTSRSYAPLPRHRFFPSWRIFTPLLS